jgi:hypothetical protein
MDWLRFLFSFREFYAFAVPYIVYGAWAYHRLGKRQYASLWAVFWSGIAFLLIFLLGFFILALAVTVIIMFRHAEKL